jgi:hypothetical protein
MNNHRDAQPCRKLLNLLIASTETEGVKRLQKKRYKELIEDQTDKKVISSRG